MTPDLKKYPLAEQAHDLQRQQAAFFSRALPQEYLAALSRAVELVDSCVLGADEDRENVLLAYLLLHDKKMPRSKHRLDAPLIEGGATQRLCPPAVMDVVRFEAPLNFDANVLLLQARALQAVVSGQGDDTEQFTLLEAFAPRLLAALKGLPVAEKPAPAPQEVVLESQTEPDFSNCPLAGEVYREETGYLLENNLHTRRLDPEVFAYAVQMVDATVDEKDKEAVLITAVLQESHQMQARSDKALARIRETYGSIDGTGVFLSQTPHIVSLQARYAVTAAQFSFYTECLQKGRLPEGMTASWLRAVVENPHLAADDRWLAKDAPQLQELYHKVYEGLVLAGKNYLDGRAPEGPKWDSGSALDF